MIKGKKGDWVKISEIVLFSKDRSENLPNDTKKVDLKMWTKGFLETDANTGDKVEIITRTGRKVAGMLEEINPVYTVSFGKYVPELSKIGDDARKELMEAEKL